MKIAIISFTDRGRRLAETLASCLGESCVFYDKERECAGNFLAREFTLCGAIIFIGAAGIAVRLIAPLIVSKESDPAVVVLDEWGNFAIPILSGHIGGANALARRISQIEALSCTAVITTATDVNGLFSIDEWAMKAGCAPLDTAQIKCISAAVLRGEKPAFLSDFEIAGELPKEFVLAESGKLGIYISLSSSRNPFFTTLKLVPKIVTIGVGCRRGTPFEALEDFVLAILRDADISLKSVRGLASIDIKSDEACILKLAEKYKLPLKLFSAGELSALNGDFTASGFVKETTGADNVCERSAAAEGGHIIIKKTAREGITLAASLSDWRCVF